MLSRRLLPDAYWCITLYERPCTVKHSLPHLFFFVRRKWYPPFSQRFWATGDYTGRGLSSAYLLASFSASTNRDPSPLPLLVSALHRLHSKARIWFRPIHADASPSQLNQTNKPPHIARKLRFSEIRSGMLFITSLLVEDFRHSLIVLILLPKTMD